MRIENKRFGFAVAMALTLSIILFAAAAATHWLSYSTSQTTSSGNWTWWETGFSWAHYDSVHFTGYARSGGTPSAGGTYDSIYVSDWAGSSCNNGVTWPYSANGSTSASNSNLVLTAPGFVYSPSCSSSPKFKSSSYHAWSDGTWSMGRSQVRTQ